MKDVVEAVAIALVIAILCECALMVVKAIAVRLHGGFSEDRYLFSVEKRIEISDVRGRFCPFLERLFRREPTANSPGRAWTKAPN
ncbi:hypothetical protein [Bradyrhizobium genosp. SA-3]|uniref:hypothetical protein n=1 Tax=Bradyrhizobium genosp. SA-3 TaxID=508868 RepID=UPI0010291790|nr:hypothetical protein [Bradyrhizobium genosp. SA-3]